MKASIIGAGNLGGAIACGLAKGTFITAENITCADHNPNALARLRATGLGFNLVSDARKAVRGADLLILAVKPYAVRETIAQIADLIDYDRQILFSSVGGLSFEELEGYMFEGPEWEDKIKPNPIHFRIMPNIAISVGESMTFITSRNANSAQIKLAESIFGEMGLTMVVPERLMPAAMAVGSCGIAYVMRYFRASMNGAVEAGFTAADAHDIVLQVMKGALKLLFEDGEHPEVEIDRVITPGGYTIKGLNAMEERGFSSAIIAGIKESYKNSK
jgi:pyrroline-5-carboxylate reductase